MDDLPILTKVLVLGYPSQRRATLPDNWINKLRAPSTDRSRQVFICHPWSSPSGMTTMFWAHISVAANTCLEQNHPTPTSRP